MPANLSPEYKAAADAFRKARDPAERLEHLREMLRVIPKHKGTDHLQADLKRRIKELDEELAGPKRGGARGGPALVIRPEGAAQIALLGAPNAGKSLLHDRLTGSGARSGPYPFTTQYPEPGMLRWQDVHFQLVDLPAIDAGHPVPWLTSTLHSADACLLVVDLADPDCVQQVTAVQQELARRKVSLVTRWPADAAGQAVDVGRRSRPTKTSSRCSCRRCCWRTRPTCSTTPTPTSRCWPSSSSRTSRDCWCRRRRAPGSASSVSGCGGSSGWCGSTPRRPASRPSATGRSRCAPASTTVEDAARLVHRDMARTLKYARVWGRSVTADGQHVGREHRLADGDVLELHA